MNSDFPNKETRVRRRVKLIAVPTPNATQKTVAAAAGYLVFLQQVYPCKRYQQQLYTLPNLCRFCWLKNIVFY